MSDGWFLDILMTKMTSWLMRWHFAERGVVAKRFGRETYTVVLFCFAPFLKSYFFGK